MRDIGRAEDGTKEQRSVARLNGVPTVTLEVRRQSGANTVAVIEAVKANLASGPDASCPPDVELEIIRDQSRYIYAALHEINLHLVLGSILACLVVLAFMRSWRSTVIAAVAIPTSVIATFGMMKALDFTLNSVTMLALVLMVGIVIDDAIVVLENIFRFVEEKKMDSFEAARAATAEIGLAVLATTLSLVVIFVPVSFMSSISGRFLYQFGITAAVAVLVSSARLVHADADDERAPAARRGRDAARRRRPRDRQLAAAASTPGSTASTTRLLRLADAAPPARPWSALARHAGLGPRSTGWSRSGVHPERRRRGGVRGQRHRARGHQPRRPWTRPCAPIEAEIRDVRGVAHWCSPRRAAASSAASTRARVFVRIAPHEERKLLASAASCKSLIRLDPAARLPRQLHASAT